MKKKQKDEEEEEEEETRRNKANGQINRSRIHVTAYNSRTLACCCGCSTAASGRSGWGRGEEEEDDEERKTPSLRFFPTQFSKVFNLFFASPLPPSLAILIGS
jgi:hypothetical protein